MLKYIANNEPPATETLYDQPEIDEPKIHITAPFTVETLPAPVVKPPDDIGDWEEDISAKLELSRVESQFDAKFLQVKAETKEETPRRAAICFAGESKPLDST